MDLLKKLLTLGKDKDSEKAAFFSQSNATKRNRSKSFSSNISLALFPQEMDENNSSRLSQLDLKIPEQKAIVLSQQEHFSKILTQHRLNNFCNVLQKVSLYSDILVFHDDCKVGIIPFSINEICIICNIFIFSI